MKESFLRLSIPSGLLGHTVPATLTFLASSQKPTSTLSISNNYSVVTGFYIADCRTPETPNCSLHAQPIQKRSSSIPCRFLIVHYHDTLSVTRSAICLPQRGDRGVFNPCPELSFPVLSSFPAMPQTPAPSALQLGTDPSSQKHLTAATNLFFDTFEEFGTLPIY